MASENGENAKGDLHANAGRVAHRGSGMDGAQNPGYGLVVLDSSVFVTVPFDDWVTVLSFVLTLPSLLTLLVLVWEISWAHPTSSHDNANAGIPFKIAAIRFFILSLPVRGNIKSGRYLDYGVNFAAVRSLSHKFTRSALRRVGSAWTSSNQVPVLMLLTTLPHRLQTDLHHSSDRSNDRRAMPGMTSSE